MSSFDKMYEHWDQQMVGPNPDYNALVKQMLSVSKTMVSVDVELCWRLAAALFSMTNNMDWETDREVSNHLF